MFQSSNWNFEIIPRIKYNGVGVGHYVTTTMLLLCYYWKFQNFSPVILYTGFGQFARVLGYELKRINHDLIDL